MASVALPDDASMWRRFRLRMENAGHWVYLLPALIFFIGYQLYPILSVLWMSFTDFHYLRSDPVNFIGLQNYINAVNDPLVWQGLGRALVFTILFLPGCIFIPLFLAILVDRVKNAAGVQPLQNHSADSGGYSRPDDFRAVDVAVRLRHRPD